MLASQEYFDEKEFQTSEKVYDTKRKRSARGLLSKYANLELQKQEQSAWEKSLEKKSYMIDDTMNVLFDKLDEAIDDMENGKVQTIEEAWEEINSV